MGSFVEVHENGLRAVAVMQVDIDDDGAVLVVREVSYGAGISVASR